MMPIPPISGVGASAASVPVSPSVSTPGSSTASAGFADAMRNGLEEVSRLEHRADHLIEQMATGGPAQIHEVMIATTQASLAVDVMVHVRDRAVEAYHEIMRMQL